MGDTYEYEGHQPTSAAILGMVARLERVQRKHPETRVRMSQYRIETARKRSHGDESYCGTSACHGGYYLLAKVDEWVEAGNPLRYAYKVNEGGVLEQVDFGTCFEQYEYRQGANWLALDLGFKNDTGTGTGALNDLTWWARCHPELWGNSDGAHMFGGEDAFGWDDDYQPVLQDIINHWRGVAERVREREETGE